MRCNAWYRVLGMVLAALASICPDIQAQPPRSDKVEIVAYINQRWGCQQPTEDFLATVVKEHRERVTFEVVDFGGKGLKRWRDDGMNCMGIRLNGSTATDIVHKGVTIPVRFEMPVGYQWTHEELAVAIRQMLHGVAEADRRPPEVEVRETDTGAALLIDGNAVLALPDVKRLRDAARVLREASQKPLTREDFATRMLPAGAELVVRDRTLLKIGPEDAKRAGKDIPELGNTWLDGVAAAYPAVQRPFPGTAGLRKGPPRR